VHLANRTASRSQALAEQFGAQVKPLAWDAIGDVLPRAGLLVNTTSLGMKVSRRSRSTSAPFHPERQSQTLCMCRLKPIVESRQERCSLKTADGLGMLLHQAVRGSNCWFGKRPSVTPELRAR
jgi:shikimate dehydrogenase